MACALHAIRWGSVRCVEGVTNSDVLSMIRGFEYLEVLRTRYELATIHGVTDHLDRDRGLTVVEGHIDPRDMTLVRKDPGDCFQFLLIPLGHDAGGQIDVHFFRFAMGTRPQFPDAIRALGHFERTVCWMATLAT